MFGTEQSALAGTGSVILSSLLQTSRFRKRGRSQPGSQAASLVTSLRVRFRLWRVLPRFREPLGCICVILGPMKLKPVSVVGIFLTLSRSIPILGQSSSGVAPQMGSVLEAIQRAGIYLSILLVFVGVSVLMVMLKIREEQYLYVKTIKGTRK